MTYRVHRHNRPLFELPPSHPAALALVAHADCREKCVGHEIAWPGKEADAFDQEWYSQIDDRLRSFSGFAYEFISYDLVLDGWIERPSELTECESAILNELPRLRGLIGECEIAAEADDNRRVLDRISIVRNWLDALENAILHRMKLDDIAPA